METQQAQTVDQNVCSECTEVKPLDYSVRITGGQRGKDVLFCCVQACRDARWPKRKE